MLGRKPLTVSEVRSRLRALGHADSEVDRVIRKLAAARYVDDARLASHWLTVRAERGGRGPRRLLAELLRRGVPEAVARRAWRELLDRGDVDPAALAAKEARRRAAAHGGKLDRKRYAAVYNALFRAGFEPETIRVAIDPYRAEAGGVEEDPSEFPDDVP
jgi:SOS response regulatory protein OraA/RecX